MKNIIITKKQINEYISRKNTNKVLSEILSKIKNNNKYLNENMSKKKANQFIIDYYINNNIMSEEVFHILHEFKIIDNKGNIIQDA